MAAHVGHLGAAVLIGVGAAFDFSPASRSRRRTGSAAAGLDACFVSCKSHGGFRGGLPAVSRLVVAGPDNDFRGSDRDSAAEVAKQFICWEKISDAALPRRAGELAFISAAEALRDGP